MVRGIDPTGRRRNLDRPRHVGPRTAQSGHEVVESEFAVARCPTVLQAVPVVVVAFGDPRSVVQLHTGDQFAGQVGDRRQVTCTSFVVPDVDAHPTVRPTGVLHDAPRRVHRHHVGERQELEADDETVVGGPVAQRAERSRAALQVVGRADHLEVATPELVGHAPGDGFEFGSAVAAGTVGSQSGNDLDLGQTDLMAREEFAKSPGRVSLGFEPLVLPDEQSDRPDPVLSGQADPIFDRVHGCEREVAEHELFRRESARIRLIHDISVPQHAKGSVMASTGRLDGKVAVITGGASGIGEGTVRRFVEEGARVVVADVQDEPGHALASEIGSAARFVHTDVTSEDDVAAAVDRAVAEFGRLDVMFNNAGIVGAVGRIAETPAEQWDRTVAILMRGVFLGMKHASRVMVPQGSGAIISTSSTAGILGGLGPHCYTACKHAVIGLTKSVASELAQHGVRVNAISPGNTVTAMTSAVMTGDHTAIDVATKHIASGSLLGIAGLPVDIANAAVYLASDEARYVTGHTLVVDAGQTTIGGNGRFHQQDSALLREAGRREKA